MSAARTYEVPRSADYGGILHTRRCDRCGVAVVATDHRELEPNGTKRHVWLDARYVAAGRAPEHQCDRREKKVGRGALWD